MPPFWESGRSVRAARVLAWLAWAARKCCMQGSRSRVAVLSNVQISHSCCVRCAAQAAYTSMRLTAEGGEGVLVCSLADGLLLQALALRALVLVD